MNIKNIIRGLSCLILLFIGVSILHPSIAQQITLKDIYKSSKYKTTSGLDIYFSKLGDYYLKLEKTPLSYNLKKVYIKPKRKKPTQEIIAKFDHSLYEKTTFLPQYSNDEQYILAYSNKEKIYRHSYKANFYIVNLQSKQKIDIAENKKILYPTFSPDNTKVAYVYENNLYIYFIKTKKSIQITKDGKTNEIINAMGDWVYEEELGVNHGFKWSEDSSRIVYYKFDDRDVPLFHYVEHEKENAYPILKSIRYPKVNQKIPKVFLFVYNLTTRQNFEVDLQSCCEYYIPLIKWFPKTNRLLIVKLNRAQNKMELKSYDTESRQLIELKTIFTKYYFLVNDDRLLISEKTSELLMINPDKKGTNQLYRFDTKKRHMYQITNDDFEITKLYAINDKSKLVFFQSTKSGSTYRGIYVAKYRTSYIINHHKEIKFYDAKFREDGMYYVLEGSLMNSTPKSSLYKFTGKHMLDVSLNDRLDEKIQNMDLSTVTYFSLASPPYKFNAFIVKPKNFDPNKKYPVIIYVYGGPGSQVVANKWNIKLRLLAQYFADRGFIYAAMDGRGTGFNGGNQKNTVLQDLGNKEIQDQIFFSKYLQKLPWVDADNIGIWGWSYGGYVSAMSMMNKDHIFKAGVSVAPVTDWRFYDATYTERYMGLYDKNMKGYNDSSVLSKAETLKGNFLLIHGLADDNVHFQNSVRLSEELIKYDKRFDQRYYPNQAHSINKGNGKIHVMNEIVNFFTKYLKNEN